MKAWLAAGLAASLVACAPAPVRPDPPAGLPASTVGPPSEAAAVAGVPEACLQTREHRDEDYTPGGLYAPGVADSAPAAALDISGLVEPEPRSEPYSQYGNRSPYTVLGKSYRVLDRADGYVERGIASWYGQKFHGRQTSSREVYDMCAFSAAHKTLPLPSYVRVINLDNGRSVVVRVNDRGPFHRGRIIDLSYAAAVKLGVDRTGTAPVEVQALTGGRDPGPVQVLANTPSRPHPPRFVHGGRQVIQVGSFSEKDNAKRIVERLRDAGLDDVDIEDARVDGRKVWRVRVGPVTGATAARLLERVQALGLPGARLFRE